MFRKEFHSTQLSSSAVKHHYYEFHVKLKGKRLDFIPRLSQHSVLVACPPWQKIKGSVEKGKTSLWNATFQNIVGAVTLRDTGPTRGYLNKMPKSWRLTLAKLFNSIIMTIQAICDCCRRVQELCSRAVGYINNLLAEWFLGWKLLAGILESVSWPAGLRLASYTVFLGIIAVPRLIAFLE